MQEEAGVLTRTEATKRLFLAKQARLTRMLVERVEIGFTDADLQLQVEGLASLVRDLSGIAPETRRAE